MLRLIVKAPNPGRGWGLALMLLAGLVHAQVFSTSVNFDTRPLFTSSVTADSLSDSRLEPLELAQITQPRITSTSLYDDVYQNTGDQTSNRIDRLEQLLYLELPLGSGKGGLAIEFRQVSADVRLNSYPEEVTGLGYYSQRFSAALGRQLAGGRLIAGAQLGVNHLTGEWLPEGALSLAVKPFPRVTIVAGTGSHSELRTFDWKRADDRYQADVKLRHSRWSSGLSLDISPQVRAGVNYSRDRIQAPSDWYTAADFGFDPDLSTRELRAALRFMSRKSSSLEISWSRQLGAGSGEAFYTEDSTKHAGKLTVNEYTETDLELAGTCQLATRSRIAIAYGNFHIIGSQKGHLDLWPFSPYLFGSFKSIYYRGQGTARLECLTAVYTRDAGLGGSWSFQVSYLRLRPDYRLKQIQTTLGFPFGFDDLITISELALISTELLVPAVRKTFTFGNTTLTYDFNKAVPIRLRYREEPPTVEPPAAERQVRGGNYHLLTLAYTW